MKVSVPKETIEKIMADYGVSQDEAVKAYLDAQEKAFDIFNTILSSRLGEPRKAVEPEFEVTVYTPREIKQHLDRYVIGQEEYKARLSIAASYHFAMVKHLQQHPEEDRVRRFRKKNTITAGPSGSGKTYCVEVLGDLLKVPTLIIDATDYTEAGYVGKNSDDMVRELIDLAPGKSRKEQAAFIGKYGGLIFIDEFDKKAKERAIIGHDIGGEGFQRSVLKLVERKAVPMDNPYSAVHQLREFMDQQQGRRSGRQEHMVSTENILFILGGSFERLDNSLEQIVKKRLSRRGATFDDEAVVIEGFAARPGDEGREKREQTHYDQAISDDFIAFGLLPEIVGRAPIRTFVKPLSRDDLVRIMKETKDSILHQYTLEFSLFGITVEFTDDAIEFVAERSQNRKTGARALVSTWEGILTRFQYELPGSGVNTLVVDRKLCEDPETTLASLVQH